MSRVFAIADLHGQYQLWQKVKEYLNPDDKIYFLGDAIDRGKYGYELMKELLCDSRVIYIKGNHEQMMEDAIREIGDIARGDGAYLGEKYQLWAWNGCYPTLEAWEAAGAMHDWVRVLRKMTLEDTYINQNGQEICLCHAGFTPGGKPTYKEDFLWNRKHFREEIPEKYKDGNFIVVHGHTPTAYLMEDFDQLNRELATFYRGDNRDIPQYEFTEVDGAVFYGDGTKIDIDCGAFATGHTVLLDLDTFEVISFDAEIE